MSDSSEGLVFLIPTRHRRDALVRSVDAISATCTTPHHIFVGFDDDHVNFTQWRPRPNVTPLLFTPRHYFVRAMNRLYAEARRAIPEMRYFVVLNDDDVFVRHGWDRLAIESFNVAYPDGRGLVELFWGGRIHCYLSHVALFDERGGRLYDPVYTQYWGDQELLDDLKREGRYQHVEIPRPSDHLVAHNTLSTLDSLASETWATWNQVDTDIYHERKRIRG